MLYILSLHILYTSVVSDDPGSQRSTTVDFLLRNIDTMGVLIHCEAVHLLLYGEIFQFAEVIRIVFLKHRNCFAVASHVNAFESGIELHNIGALGKR